MDWLWWSHSEDAGFRRLLEKYGDKLEFIPVEN